MSDINRGPHDPAYDRSGQQAASESVAAQAAGGGKATRENLVAREEAEYGGMKFGAAFFGWLAATGATVILTALLAATGTAIGLGNNADPEEILDEATSNASTVGILGAVILGLIVLIAYFCGGYTAGRMARFDGIKQGIAVWLWAIIIVVVLAIIAVIAGSQTNILANLNLFPRIPIDEGDLTAGSIITLVGALILSLVGAILGGMAGMRFHRRVDDAGVGH